MIGFCITFMYCITTITPYDYDSLLETEILTNLSISAFLDENRYIRLNISWSDVLDSVDQISIRFVEDTEADNTVCGVIDSLDRISVAEKNNIIIPSLTLSNPADELLNGCEYKTVVETHDLNPNFKQIMMYQIPECVHDKCRCKEKSPYQLSSIIPLHDDNYLLKWNELSHENLTLISIYCTRNNNSLGNSSTTTFIKVQETNVFKDGTEILLPDIKEDVTYKITANFHHDGCAYRSSITFKVPKTRTTLTTIVGLILLVVVLLVLLFAVLIKSNKYKRIFEKYTKCWKQDEVGDIYAIKPLSCSFRKEEINSQYTPLEFVLNSYNYDKYEFPKNKIILKQEIGKGAFGTVYYGEAFELNNNPGYTKVAIKQLREGAPDEEKQDLLNEIRILKKVGEHENIVKLLGCVTINQPYMILLELVPCGSLKDYLLKLRENWSMRKTQFFFTEFDSQKLKYAKVIFDTTDDSYITPDNISLNDLTENEVLNLEYMSESLKPEKSQAPQSPISIVSSGLISCADTELTSLPSLPPTPEIRGKNDGYFQRAEPLLDNGELQQFAQQIARGMGHLEKIKVTHRDLAARNILMTSEKILKISDFGLSRVGIYVSKQGQKLPLRWMAIEAIEEKTCTNKSDVWSFGVVLWEIGTLGGFPYSKTHNNLILYELKQGKRLERPKICTDELYKLMMDCWSEKPEDRPTFSEIIDQLDERKKIYVNFNKLSPTYDFPISKEPEIF
ncbi:platelet-derived growth factor receptor alpha isoform X1 [Diorhabda sublineata]|uniref:platelet-derived growth factor receptor alpha isoform X1 n=1 Tax=Diorhabda sublineata TaxID=1163346 RepID=UPI0024E0A901|nr:platelet-derived growth factor receptor alpha isoform X1 [Diorhabda sublineata]XP_056644593.1 platelet-derived growth factor receptor alpha isoform X1 [Diorhabda sublineata]